MANNLQQRVHKKEVINPSLLDGGQDHRVHANELTSRDHSRNTTGKNVAEIILKIQSVQTLQTSK